MIMEVVIPARLAAQFAAGTVTLMNSSAGATTALVSSSTGSIVGTAGLVPASGGASAAAGMAVTAGAASIAPIVFAASGVVIVGTAAVFVGRKWTRDRARRQASLADNVVQLHPEHAPSPRIRRWHRAA
jgi:hypothetical protein